MSRNTLSEPQPDSASYVDQGSDVECTASHPRLTKSTEKEERSMYVFFCMGASISIGQEIWCLPYAGLLVLSLQCAVCNGQFTVQSAVYNFQCEICNI